MSAIELISRGSISTAYFTQCRLPPTVRAPRSNLKVDAYRPGSFGFINKPSHPSRLAGVKAELSSHNSAFLTPEELSQGGTAVARCLMEMVKLEKEKGALEKEKGVIEKEKGAIEKEKGVIEKEKFIVEREKEKAIADLRVLMAQHELAVEVATNRTMDQMRDLGMLHARGVLEYAEMEQRRGISGKRPARKKLWDAILERKPKLKSCLEQQSGWGMGEISGQIESLYRNLNGRMHRVATPQYTARSRDGIVLQDGGPGSGLSSIQINALICICEAFFIRYTPYDVNMSPQVGSDGINTTSVADLWKLEQDERKEAENNPKPFRS